MRILVIAALLLAACGGSEDDPADECGVYANEWCDYIDRECGLGQDECIGWRLDGCEAAPTTFNAAQCSAWLASRTECVADDEWPSYCYE